MAANDIPEALPLAQLPTSTVTGIYFLWQADMVVYVGQSKTIGARICQHIADGTKMFDGVSWIACPPQALTKVERSYIDRLIPHYNRCGAANKARNERPWIIEKRITGTSMAASLGLTDEQFDWLRKQPGGPRPIRVPRRNRRRWVWPALLKWATNNRDMLEAAKAQTI